MQSSDIAWTDWTWNPVTGCSKVGPECENCWAERLSLRQGWTDSEWTHNNAAENVECHEDRLDQPFEYSFDDPGRIFVVSMGDLFHREVPDSFVRRVVEVARQMPEHEFQFLTKRPDRAASIDLPWPDNAIVGTSVGSGPGGDYPDTTHRIDQLRDVDARRWISFEPLVEPVGDVDLSGIDWVVVGGESGPADVRREMDHEWAREILSQAREYDVPYFFKQSSARYPDEGTRLTVENEDFGVYEQRKIREYPEPSEITMKARNGEVTA